MAAAIEPGEEGLDLVKDNLRFVEKSIEFGDPPNPERTTSNRVVLELDTVRLRNFSLPRKTSTQTPVLVDAPCSGQSSTIAGQITKPERGEIESAQFAVNGAPEHRRTNDTMGILTMTAVTCPRHKGCVRRNAAEWQSSHWPGMRPVGGSLSGTRMAVSELCSSQRTTSRLGSQASCFSKPTRLATVAAMFDRPAPSSGASKSLPPLTLS